MVSGTAQNLREQSPTHGPGSLAAKSIIALLFSGIMLLNYSANFAGHEGMDFQMFYSAAQMVRHGEGAKLYDVVAQRYFQAQTSGEVGLIFNYPPATALLYLPPGLLAPQWAYVLWTAISMAILAISTFLLNRTLHVFRDGFWAYLLSFLFLPVHILFLQGQVDGIVLLAFVLALIAMNARKDFLAGFALSLGLFKFHLVLPFVGVLILRRSWRWLGGFAAGSAIFFAICIAVAGPRFIGSYLSLLLHLNRIPMSGYAPEKMANLHGLLFLFFGAEPHLWIILLLSSLLFAITVAAWEETEYGFAAVIAMSVLASYHLNPHDLLLLIVPLAISLKNIRWRSLEGALVLIIGFPFVPKILLSTHSFAVLAIAVIAFWVILLRKTGLCTWSSHPTAHSVAGVS